MPENVLTAKRKNSASAYRAARRLECQLAEIRGWLLNVKTVEDCEPKNLSRMIGYAVPSGANNILKKLQLRCGLPDNGFEGLADLLGAIDPEGKAFSKELIEAIRRKKFEVCAPKRKRETGSPDVSDDEDLEAGMELIEPLPDGPTEIVKKAIIELGSVSEMMPENLAKKIGETGTVKEVRTIIKQLSESRGVDRSRKGWLLLLRQKMMGPKYVAPTADQRQTAATVEMIANFDLPLEDGIGIGIAQIS
jgi:hypothetical protein